MPIWYLAPFKAEASVTGFADNRTVKEPGADYWTLANINAGLIWDGHTGLDCALGGIGTPLYAVESGIILEAQSTPGSWGGAPSGTHLALHDGTYKGEPSAWGYSHMNSLAVQAGERVVKGQLVGTMGNTGDSHGAHLHLNKFIGTPGKDLRYFDPLPFLDGRSVIIPDVQENTEMIIMPNTKYKYIDTPGNIRTGYGLSAPKTGKTIATGAIVTVTAFASADGYSWARISPTEWFAIGMGDTPWVEQVIDTIVDTAEIDRLKSENEMLLGQNKAMEADNADLITENTALELKISNALTDARETVIELER